MRNSGGGRAIFPEFQVELFPWLDDCMAMDIDTPEDYEKMKAVLSGGGHKKLASLYNNTKLEN